MYLSREEILAAVNGALRTEQTIKGLEFHRFTKEQEEFFYKPHPLYKNDPFFDGYFGRNCRTSAGITLEFTTDADQIAISFADIEYTNKTSSALIDLFVDGEYISSAEAEETTVFPLCGGTHRCVLYLPHFAFTVVSCVSLGNATVYEPIKKKCDLLFLGDSITHGAKALHPSMSYTSRVTRSLGVGALNQGNSGFVYDVGSLGAPLSPRVVITAYGINDFWKKSPRVIDEDTRLFLHRTRELYPDATLVSILPTPTKWDKASALFKKAEREALERIYRDLGDVCINGHELMPNEDKYFTDGVHPTDEGFGIYAARLLKYLEPIVGNTAKENK